MDLLVPSILVGPKRAVAGRMKKVIRTVIASESWKIVQQLSAFENFSESNVPIFFHPPGGDGLQLYMPTDALFHQVEAPTRAQTIELCTRLTYLGYSEPWFAFSRLSLGLEIPGEGPSSPYRKAHAVIFLTTLLPHWDTICGQAHRFFYTEAIPMEWPGWGRYAFRALVALGKPVAEVTEWTKLAPDELGDHIRDSLAGQRPVQMNKS